jgi:hypothetical protein
MKGTVRRVERCEQFRGKIEFVVGIGHEKGLLGSSIKHSQLGRTRHRPIAAVSSFISLGLVGGGPLVVPDRVLSKPQGKIAKRTQDLVIDQSIGGELTHRFSGACSTYSNHS